MCVLGLQLYPQQVEQAQNRPQETCAEEGEEGQLKREKGRRCQQPM